MPLPPKKKISRFKTVRKPSTQPIEKSSRATPPDTDVNVKTIRPADDTNEGLPQMPSPVDNIQSQEGTPPKTMPLEKQIKTKVIGPKIKDITPKMKVERSGLIPNIPNEPAAQPPPPPRSQPNVAVPTPQAVPVAVPVQKARGGKGEVDNNKTGQGKGNIPLAKVISHAAQTGKSKQVTRQANQVSQAPVPPREESAASSVPAVQPVKPAVHTPETTSAPPSPHTPPKAKIVSLGAKEIKQDVPVAQRIVSEPQAPKKESSGNVVSQAPPPSPIHGKTIVKQQEELVEAELEALYEQIQNYLEVCDSLSLCDNPFDTIDVIHMFIISLNLDVVSFATVNFHNQDKPLSVISRGFNIPPDNSVVAVWAQAANTENGIDWIKLMDIIEDTSHDLATWILEEGLVNVGYVPVHDGNIIYGFLMLGSHQKSLAKSQIASPLLELCGGRIGMVIANKKLEKIKSRVEPNVISDTHTGELKISPDEILKYADDIRQQFALLLGSLEMFKVKSNPDKNDIEHFAESFKKSLTEGLHSLDVLTHYIKK